MKNDLSPDSAASARKGESAFRQKLDADFLSSSSRVAGEMDEVRFKLLHDRLKTVTDYFLPFFIQRDQEALYYQKRYCQASKAIFILAAAAVSIVSFQYIFHLNHYLVLGELSAIVAILVLIHYGKRRGWHQNWLDYRLLAEKFRIAMLVSFLRDRHEGPEEHAWSCKWVSDSWCLNHFKDIWQDRPLLPSLTAEDLPLLRDFLRRFWLIDQRRFHEKKAERELARHRWISRAGEACFWLTLVAAVLHLMPHSLFHDLHLPYDLSMKILTFMAIALPATGSALAGLRSHFEFKKMSDRSKMMAGHLRRLEEMLSDARDITRFEHVVGLTESLMLQENADWHINIAYNRLEPPA